MVPTPGLWARCRYPPVLDHTHAHDHAAAAAAAAAAASVAAAAVAAAAVAVAAAAAAAAAAVAGYAESSSIHRCRYSAEAQTQLLHEVWKKRISNSEISNWPMT